MIPEVVWIFLKVSGRCLKVVLVCLKCVLKEFCRACKSLKGVFPDPKLFWHKQFWIELEMDSSWSIVCGAEIHVGLGPHYPSQKV